MALDANATSVEPTGIGRSLLIVTIIFLIITTIIIASRCWVRLRYKTFGVDDGLMLFGWMLYVGVSCIVARSTYAGLGTKDTDLNAYLQNDGRKFLWFFQVTYCISLLFLKSSICVTLLRIAVVQTHRIIIWCTLAFALLSITAVIIGLFVICRPISTAWGHVGTCAPPIVIASLGYLVSTGAVVTDFICAILPIFMLYHTNMKLATKVSLAAILGLAALASLCTIVRLPYVKYYIIIPDYLYNVTHIVIWSILESGIGIVAGSLPSLRQLVNRRFQFDSNSESSPAQNTPFSGAYRATITSQSVPRSRSAGLGEGDGDWEELDDSSSRKKIYVNVDVEMQTFDRATTSGGPHRSTEDLVR
ncbi:hypothetical protein FVEN_g8140 [Fusarium venenatum]|uniref:Rhodopsin domain-containing protein n=1 Tax=Fusarium venenatum TaxID=56646 RepID=A0A2L2SUX5_9HYPO|nr:uncharacterized protein FVRRES_04505 [Fusarium venenatum]KAG8353929.1 hypothetical protein FVEN_g8140 [Fusarium venenatum]KAH6991666.1 hypothetical protein EDB82DRAFT_553479 [Fusarium venenatum]CEI60069.1 unnamed protein product [Fusarium venenatum]